MDRQKILDEIFRIRSELIERVATIRKEIFGIKDMLQLKLLPAWAMSRLRDENGDVRWEYAGYGDRILVVELHDPWTEDKNKRERKTAFVIYFSLQTSKPLVPAQLKFKLNSVYKVVNKLRAKGYHVFPAVVVYNATPGAKEMLQKHKVEFFNDLDNLLGWIYSKLLSRLQRLVEVTKFTFQFDRIFLFLKKVIEGLGYKIPSTLLEAWAYKPKYPQAST
ncbi:hypothetical protein [Acidianus sp. HS-5]|uniref:hypothetical protein n=1 Tax=Acidianus sp. HS-5 TaxID=2886040 RepID=UPI001F25CD42|nr:hypothetical protein [Acidianus sp. HS-5]BDC18217.1 hypothetical protein HS5_11070 [Acidianus sp. HS-5]